MSERMNRRTLLRVGISVPLTVPFGLAHWLSTRDTKELPPVKSGQLLTARTLNEIIDRLNELSRSQ